MSLFISAIKDKPFTCTPSLPAPETSGLISKIREVWRDLVRCMPSLFQGEKKVCDPLIPYKKDIEMIQNGPQWMLYVTTEKNREITVLSYRDSKTHRVHHLQLVCKDTFEKGVASTWIYAKPVKEELGEHHKVMEIGITTEWMNDEFIKGGEEFVQKKLPSILHHLGIEKFGSVMPYKKEFRLLQSEEDWILYETTHENKKAIMLSYRDKVTYQVRHVQLVCQETFEGDSTDSSRWICVRRLGEEIGLQKYCKVMELEPVGKYEFMGNGEEFLQVIQQQLPSILTVLLAPRTEARLSGKYEKLSQQLRVEIEGLKDPNIVEKFQKDAERLLGLSGYRLTKFMDLLNRVMSEESLGTASTSLLLKIKVLTTLYQRSKEFSYAQSLRDAMSLEMEAFIQRAVLKDMSENEMVAIVLMIDAFFRQMALCLLEPAKLKYKEILNEMMGAFKGSTNMNLSAVLQCFVYWPSAPTKENLEILNDPVYKKFKDLREELLALGKPTRK